ncbi:bifunctional 2',3'-cyclic-nucleotide 2'-phosphodiesterase/3'-nucleotidase [Aliiroseovarius subalbicans]|uniref:bifunctional 2',3'-cyclic-nucleotide 2'-phosphodiesterase/3'-nucleotidase n=1 Tax=Aliiroseovarius subalbicans TaxID=2925840 RepID=UPI0023AFB9BA|nr:bifunctional 2',3'-cyclic-nucleotide 2'-phosphodiesterase/3'-nucleotidase [Aliiroseovarius subalbicans]MCI2399426.1 bifunctional 2',3'-cyclic-nucleotide 2'-phosphodiesterase/3'-nucleotidase [Aliiroseovarius subalbicans]
MNGTIWDVTREDPLAGAFGLRKIRLRVMATTDLHMHLLAHDYYSDAPSPTRGFARTAMLIEQARGEVANAVLLDNGDFLTGTLPGDHVTLHPKNEAPAPEHPMIRAMNALRYDAATLGNHDFDRGLDFLRDSIAGAQFPFVSANTLAQRGETAGEDQPLIPPHVILTRHLTDTDGRPVTLRLGVIGFLPPRSIRPRGGNGASPPTRDILETARALVPKLRSAGADIVIALAHTGISPSTPSLGMENALVPLSQVAGLDVLVGGHAHQAFPGPDLPQLPGLDPVRGTIHGVPVVVPGFWGSHLGLIDLELAQQDDHTKVAAAQSTLRPIFRRNAEGIAIARVEDHPEILRLATPLHASTMTRMRKPVGATQTALHSFFALVTPSPAVQVVQQAKQRFVQDLVDRGDLPDLPLLCSASASKCGGAHGAEHFTYVKPGQVTLRDIADLYPHLNDLVVLRVNGRFIRNWLERAATIFNRVAPTAPDQLLIARSTPCYLFETIDGLEYRIDLTRPALFTPDGTPLNPSSRGGRIRGLVHAGRAVTDSDHFLLATNDFRASGGGRFPGAEDAERVLQAGDAMRDVLSEFFRAQPTQTLPRCTHWRLSAPGGTRVVFNTSPHALDLLGNMDGLHLTPCGAGPDGLIRMRLTF